MIDALSIIVIIFISKIISDRLILPFRIATSIVASLIIAMAGQLFSIIFLAQTIFKNLSNPYEGAGYTFVIGSLTKGFYWSILGLICLFFYRKNFAHKTTAVFHDNINPSDDDWGNALNEVKNNQQIAGLWARSISSAGGDRSKAEAEYLGIRAKQIYLERILRPEKIPPKNADIPQKIENKITLRDKFLDASYKVYYFCTSPTNAAFLIITAIAIIAIATSRQRS